MPRITDDRIEFLPEDRYAIVEQSNGITPAKYTALFKAAIRDGNTTKYFKFLEEIAEKDPDILQSIETRTSYVTSKDWFIEGKDANQAGKIEEMLRDIDGDPTQGLSSTDEMITSLLGSSYLTGLSFSEVVTDGKKILGFNHIPSHFLTFQGSVHYPKLWTQQSPTGENLNQAKMISHYLTQGIDPARGWLGNSVSWLYVFKRTAMDARMKFQQKYGKGFVLVTMPGEKDSYLEAWTTAERLIKNYSTVDGAVFPKDVLVEFKESASLNGDYFFTAEDNFKNSIVKVILGQESTSSSQDSNRSTASVHLEVLEQRVIDDITAIESTLTNQLLSKIKPLVGIKTEDVYEFKFKQTEIEETLDDEQETPDVDTKQETNQTTNSEPTGEE
jgi:phage gp29-like protein